MSLRMDRANQVRQILSTRGLTLYRVCQQSAEIFGRSSRFYVPHNLYYDVGNPSLIPTIHQMLALSHVTNYRLYGDRSHEAVRDQDDSTTVRGEIFFANDTEPPRVNANFEEGLVRAIPLRTIGHCNFAYSAFACFKMGMSWSASFQRVRKS